MQLPCRNMITGLSTCCNYLFVVVQNNIMYVGSAVLLMYTSVKMLDLC